MYKRFDLQLIRNIGPDLPDLGQAQLPSANDTLRPESVPEQKGFIIHIVCLGGDMERNLRADSPGKRKKTRIRHKERIRFQLPEKGQVFVRLLQILIVCQYVDGHIYLHAMRMRPGYALTHLIFREINCLCPKGICFSPDVDRVRAIMYGDLQRFERRGRNQQFGQIPLMMHVFSFSFRSAA